MTEPTRWTCNDESERNEDTDRVDAVARYLDGLDAEHLAALLRDGSLTLYGFGAVAPSEANCVYWADRVVELLVERIDEEYGDPDRGSDTYIEEEWRAAAHVFVDAVLATYPIWQCECVARERVDVRAWVAEHGSVELRGASAKIAL